MSYPDINCDGPCGRSRPADEMNIIRPRTGEPLTLCLYCASNYEYEHGDDVASRTSYVAPVLKGQVALL